MNWWPFGKRETRAGSYTDALTQLIVNQASGNGLSQPAATAALEAASGVVFARVRSRGGIGTLPGGSGAHAAPDGADRAVSWYPRGSRVCHRCGGGRHHPRARESIDVRGGYDPRSWTYRVNLAGAYGVRDP